MSVTPENIAVALGVTAPASDSTTHAQWQMWINDALMLIEARLGDVALLDQAVLDYVVREAVVAHARNPDESTQVDVAVDDARVSRRYSTSRGRVSILDEWWALLDPDLGDSGAFSIQAYGEPDTSTLESWA